MKITFITSTLHSGGSERVMSLLANALSERGYVIEIICLNRHEVFYPIVKTVQIRFAEEECNSKFIGNKMVWLRKHILNVQPDVVIAFMVEVYCVTLATMVGLKIPVISSERIDPHFFGKAKGFLRWLLLRRTTHLVVQTEQIKSFYSSKIQKKTTIMPNPVTNDVFNISSIVKKEKRIIAVGRLAYQKNYPLMFQAFASLADEFPDYKLIVFGEGPQREELEKEILRLGMEGRILMPGRTDRIIDELNKSQLFCMSSDYEGMSNAMLEAVCMGVPVVTTDVSGARDLVIDSKGGFVVEKRDLCQFENAIKMLLKDKERMKEMSAFNREKASAFKEDNIVDQWARLIVKVIECNRE